MTDRTDYCLLRLMACALNGVPPREDSLAEVDLSRLLALARKHSVAAMVCLALEDTQTFAQAEKEIRRQWLEAKNRAIRKNMLMDAEYREVCQELERRGIRYLPLKGSVLKDWYPRCGMRERADVDILIDPEKREQVKQLFLGRGYRVVSYAREVHDVYQKPPVYNFEMHAALFGVTAEELVSRWVEPQLLPVPGKSFARRLSNEDFYVYFLAHAWKHYRDGGTGLRTLADVYVLERQLGASLNRDDVCQALRRLDILDFAQQTWALAQKLFGGELPLTEREQAVLAPFLEAGTYGNLDLRVTNRLRRLQGGQTSFTRSTKLRYLWSRIFIPAEVLKISYPALARHPWLYPLFWAWRLPYKAVTRWGVMCRELAALRSSK